MSLRFSAMGGYMIVEWKPYGQPSVIRKIPVRQFEG